MDRSVTFTQTGREGQVIYHEGTSLITGHQEFGGADVVAIVSMGSAEQWRIHHAWAVERRAQILRYVADETIRQKTPSSLAEIDAASGDIVLRNAGVGAVAGRARSTAIPPSSLSKDQAADVSWVHRYSALKGKLGAIGLVALLVFGSAMWIKTRVLVIEPGKGVPIGSTLRTQTHLATLISQLQPYTPTLHHDGSTERFSVSVFLVPLDGSSPELVRLVRDLQSGSYSLARIIGSDEETMWFSVDGLYGINLRTHAVVVEADVSKANPALDPKRLNDTRGMDIANGRLQIVADDRSAAWSLDPATLKAAPVAPANVYRSLSNPSLTLNMAAGLLIPPDTWLGVHSQADIDRAFKPGRWLRPVESANDAPRDVRRLMHGEMVSSSSDNDGTLQIRSMSPVGATEFRNASFLRMDEKSEPLRITNPDSVLMLHTSGEGYDAKGTLLMSRVETPGGKLLWTKDTGIHRFKLAQILPGERITALVGTRPPVPDKVSEPILVILDHTSGQLTTHSLWR